MSIDLVHILQELPDEDASNFRLKNKALFTKNNTTCIVIDDDPTGNQTVYDIPLLTSWDLDVFIKEFLNDSPIFFVLTNSRSLSASNTKNVYTQIAKNIQQAALVTKRKFIIVSRSDSTLRGHFPLEPNTLKQKTTLDNAITVFIPVMFEGGRVTVNDIHYVLNNKTLTPVNETPFAKDHSFAYTTANLKKYIEEKTNGTVEASHVHSFSLQEIREQTPELLAKKIYNLPNTAYCIFNSLNYNDLDKVTNALLHAEKAGKKIIYRTSSSFIPSYIGLEPKPLLTTKEIIKKNTGHGGVTIVGSYVKKSSEQLKKALSLFNDNAILEIDASKVIQNGSMSYINSLTNVINSNISAGIDIIVFTSRTLITGKDNAATIQIANKISTTLVTLVKNLSSQPKYLIAKGGITSHDIAVNGLGMLRSMVIGQIIPGVPVWEMSKNCKFHELPYIVFPGNVGDNNSLYNVIKKLK